MSFKDLIRIAVVVASLSTVMPSSARPARPFYQAGRALEMGDAYTAVGTDFEAVYYNPAGIARRTRPKLKLMDFEARTSQGFISLFDGSLSKFLNLQKILAETAKNPGSPYGLGLSFLPQFLVRNFSFGILVRAQTEATSNADASINMYSNADLGGYLHYGVAFGGGVFRVGVGGKILNRAELDRIYTQADISGGGGLSFSNQWKEGLGLGFDLGALATLPVAGLPTLGVTVQDVGGTIFQDKRILFTGDSAPAGPPAALEQKINTGFSMILKQGKGLRTVLAIDCKDITRIHADYFDHLHAGFEMNFNNSFFFRGGVNEGRYWTAGFGIDVDGMGLEIGSYGEIWPIPEHRE